MEPSIERALAITFGLLTQTLAGCVTQNTPGDVTLGNVKLVDYAAESPLSGPSVSMSYFGPSAGKLVPNKVVKVHKPLLLVTVTSATDFSKLSFYQTLGVESHF